MPIKACDATAFMRLPERVAARDPRASQVHDIFGIALRATTNAVAFGSRFYASRSQQSWNEVLMLPSIVSTADFRCAEKPDDSLSVLEYIDNEIDNMKSHILRIYER